MAKAKNERNRQFVQAWKEEQLTDRELQERFGLSEGGVKGLKARLRQKDSSLYTGSPKKKLKEPSQVTSPSTSTTTQSSASTSTKRMTFWLPGQTIKAIKAKAKGEGRTASDILRKILEKEI